MIHLSPITYLHIQLWRTKRQTKSYAKGFMKVRELYKKLQGR